MSDDGSLTGSGAPSRRALLAGAGAVGASLTVAACGDSGDTSSGGPGTPSGTPGGGPNRTGPIAKTTDIPVGGGQVLTSAGVVVTQPTAGQFKGFSTTCTHKGCPVANVQNGTINCTCHGSRYSIQDGSVKEGPATRPLAAKNIKVDGEQILLG